MDTIVAQYTRAPFENEFSEQEQRDLTEIHPPISLKFNLPPVENVSYFMCCFLRSRLRCFCPCYRVSDLAIYTDPATSIHSFMGPVSC